MIKTDNETEIITTSERYQSDLKIVHRISGPKNNCGSQNRLQS